MGGREGIPCASLRGTEEGWFRCLPTELLEGSSLPWSESAKLLLWGLQGVREAHNLWWTGGLHPFTLGRVFPSPGNFCAISAKEGHEDFPLEEKLQLK